MSKAVSLESGGSSHGAGVEPVCPGDSSSGPQCSRNAETPVEDPSVPSGETLISRKNWRVNAPGPPGRCPGASLKDADETSLVDSIDTRRRSSLSEAIARGRALV